MKKKLVVLGSTGSIGTQTLEVLSHLEDQWEILALSANKSTGLIEKQARKFKPRYLVMMNERAALELKHRLSDMSSEVLSGMEGLITISSLEEADLVINALVGAVGLKPTVAALQSGNTLGLANKESLVIGGEIIKSYLNEEGRVLPVDSEHNAIFQLLNGHNDKEVERLILTASGGPFLELPRERFKDVSVKDALKHPNWDMGGKITIDSATLMNKGLEVIEAHYLFRQPYHNINVVVHPESIIHSMVEFVDKSVIAEMGSADMRMPIQYVLTYPRKVKSLAKRLDLTELGYLTFKKPDTVKFPALKLAYEAGQQGGTMPVVLNAANEIAVSAFMNEKITFDKIPVVIERVMENHQIISSPDLEDVIEVDNWARARAKEVTGQC